jgi:tetratricopeptide (TPR) repeat protein
MLASFYLVNKQFDKAEVEYKALAALDPEKPESQAVLADFYSSVNRLDEAVSLYQAIIAKSPEYRPARYRLGEILLMKGDVQGATAQVNEVLKAEQTDRQALMLRARIRMQSGRDDEIKAAVEDLKEVLKQEPDSRPALYFIAQANYNLGLIDQARSFAGDLERKFPDYLPAKLLQVQLSISIGDSKTAINLASKLLETLDKTSPDRDNTPQMLTELRLKALLARGTAQAQAKNFAAAQQDFNAARSLAPNSIDPLINLAALAKAQGKPQDSIGFYENALSMDSTNVPALSGLIDAYLASKESDKAMARVDQILASNPNNPSLHFLKAQIYGVQQNSQGAEAELRKVLELDPNYISAYSALGALFVNTHQEDRAIGEYQKILQLRPDNATAYVLIGMLEDARKNYSQAADNYKKALERDPNAVIAANNLAWLYATRKELNGNLDEAVRLAQGVVQKYPNVPGFVDTLGWVYYNKGLHAAAVDQLQKAVAADEQMAQNNGGTASPTYHYHLGAALKAKGDKTGAKKEFEIALRNAEKVPFPDQEDARRALAEL